MNLEKFVRVSDEPLLKTDAVPWAEARQVVKGSGMGEGAREVRATIMHPTVWEAARHLEDPPGRYLIYYAPHHSEGIGAAAAEEVTGPWTPLEQNPVVELDQFDGIHGHISGPDVMWIPEHGRLWMWLHGVVPEQGQQTGLAASSDGIRFKPVRTGPVLDKPYLRVFRRGEFYYGVCRFANNLGLVRSTDGIEWEEWPRGLVLQTGEEQQEYDRLRHHHVRVVGDELYIYYCTYRDPDRRVEAIRLAVMPIAGEWVGWPLPERRGDVLRPELPWEDNNIRDPFLFDAEGTTYMFYVGGNEAGIALARAAES